MNPLNAIQALNEIQALQVFQTLFFFFQTKVLIPSPEGLKEYMETPFKGVLKDPSTSSKNFYI